MTLVDKIQFCLGKAIDLNEKRQNRLREEDLIRRKNDLDDYRESRKISYEYDLKLLERNFELQRECNRQNYDNDLKLLEKRYELEKELVQIKSK